MKGGRGFFTSFLRRSREQVTPSNQSTQSVATIPDEKHISGKILGEMYRNIKHQNTWNIEVTINMISGVSNSVDYKRTPPTLSIEKVSLFAGRDKPADDIVSSNFACNPLCEEKPWVSKRHWSGKKKTRKERCSEQFAKYMQKNGQTATTRKWFW